MSNSNKTIYGYASDSTSGVESYCFNTSASPGKYTNVTPHTEQKTYNGTASSSTTYYFHVKDTAGNYKNTSSYIIIYTYHCNYCNQDTTLVHYRCPVHGNSTGCLTTSGTCNVSSYGICGALPSYIRSASTNSPIKQSRWTCGGCKVKYTSVDSYSCTWSCAKHATGYYLQYSTFCANCSVVGRQIQTGCYVNVTTECTQTRTSNGYNLTD